MFQDQGADKVFEWLDSDMSGSITKEELNNSISNKCMLEFM